MWHNLFFSACVKSDRFVIAGHWVLTSKFSELKLKENAKNAKIYIMSRKLGLNKANCRSSKSKTSSQKLGNLLKLRGTGEAEAREKMAQELYGRREKRGRKAKEIGGKYPHYAIFPHRKRADRREQKKKK